MNGQNYSNTFERYEKKFLVPPAQYPALISVLKQYTKPDQYGRHTISSIYYDTDDFAVIRRCLDRPALKEKLRLRSYGLPASQDPVYLELKKKYRGITYKRRTALTLDESRHYLGHGIRPDHADPQIFDEVDWYLRQRPLKPKLLISYDRTAFSGSDDEQSGQNDAQLRITLDQRIRWRDRGLDLGLGASGALLLAADWQLLEIKTDGALPLWLCRVLSELKIYPQSFSKYGMIYLKHLAPRGKEAIRIAG